MQMGHGDEIGRGLLWPQMHKQCSGDSEWSSFVRIYEAPSLQMVTAAMKLKDAYSLEGKLWPT